jgi:hypothetical protein
MSSPFFHGIEHLTIDDEGNVSWRGKRVEHFEPDFAQTDAAKGKARILAARCKHLEAIGKDVNKFNLREYCLSNHIEGEDLSDVPIDPEPGKQRHGQLHHVLGLGDNDRLPFEAAKPMPLAAMIPLDPISPGFAHDQSRGWDQRGIHRPMISTVERHIPLGQAIDQLLQGCRITTPALPVKEAACITIKSFPDPEFAPFFLRKCHISSISRTIAFPLGAGFSEWSAA